MGMKGWATLAPSTGSFRKRCRADNGGRQTIGGHRQEGIQQKKPKQIQWLEISNWIRGSSRGWVVGGGGRDGRASVLIFLEFLDVAGGLIDEEDVAVGGLDDDLGFGGLLRLADRWRGCGEFGSRAHLLVQNESIARGSFHQEFRTDSGRGLLLLLQIRNRGNGGKRMDNAGRTGSRKRSRKRNRKRNRKDRPWGNRKRSQQQPEVIRRNISACNNRRMKRVRSADGRRLRPQRRYPKEP